MAKIGFIGVGNMGGLMAINLIKAGHDVKIFDLIPKISRPLQIMAQSRQLMSMTRQKIWMWLLPCYLQGNM